MTTLIPRVLRHEVPVDDNTHLIRLGAEADILHIEARRPDVIEFWAIDTPGEATCERAFYVVGTGHPIPPAVKYVGTAMAAAGALVWHLFEDDEWRTA